VVGSGGTALAPTATQGGGGGTLITNTSISIEEANFTGSCPHTLNITVHFTLSRDATITYQLDAGSDTPGFDFDLPAPVQSSFSAGAQTLVFYLELTDSGSGWIRFHITDPEDVSSSQAAFSLTCQ
jgi:hypothetical protein